MNWLETKTINKYTNSPNKRYDINNKAHCLVFKRKGGWSYTVRVLEEDKLWLQKSLGSHSYYKTEEDAMNYSILAGESLIARLH